MQAPRKLLLPLLCLLTSVGSVTADGVIATAIAQNTRACAQCNIVEEGIFNQSLINTTVYLYDRSTRRFFPVTVTSIRREGPFSVIEWFDPGSGRRGKDDATNYYSYRSMQQIASSGSSSQPPLSQSQNQEKTGWLASCAMARSDNFITALIGRRACCQSTAAGRYGPDPICG